MEHGMRMEERPYRIVVTSDWHVGASTGLTNMTKHYGNTEMGQYQDRRSELWSMFTREMSDLGYMDELWMVGDIINGPAFGKAKRDNILDKEQDQVEAVFDILAWIDAKMGDDYKSLVVEGTEWHVGEGQAECGISQYLNGRPAVKERTVMRGGIKFNLKHNIGGSNRPHLLGNALVQEYNAAVSNSRQHGTEIPDVIIRAHRHVWCMRSGICLEDGVKKPWVAMILPCLQTWGSDYGKKISGGTYPDVGFVHIDIEHGKMGIYPHLFHLKTQVRKCS